MRFTYYKQTACYRRNDYDNEDDGYDFDYEVDNRDALNELPAIIADDNEVFPKDENLPWKQRLEIASRFVKLMDNIDETEGLLEYYYDDLKEVFHDEAIDSEDD